MTGFGVHTGLALLFGWVVFQILGLTPLSVIWQAALGLVAGAVFVGVARQTVLARGAVALLAPLGVALPGLVVAQFVTAFGINLPTISTLELLIFLLAYTGFLLCAFGLVPVDLYRLGYAPIPVGAMTLALCLYAALSGLWPVALVAVLGQAFWVLKLGSSNWFDHVLHILMWPVGVVVLLARFLSWAGL